MNRLERERSPYLQQHADNPVDWYPWGPEAFERARREDRPILLSVGYSACHWCHVMEHESFEDEGIATLMNERFVNVKVDREERPDIDQVYMAAVQAMAGHGGWPMTVFLTPDGRPYFGGTYFPPDDRFGRPGFPRVLLGASEAYRTRRDDVERNAGAILEHIEQSLAVQAPGDLSAQTLHLATARLGEHFDPDHGGFGGAPKFPPAMTLEFLLRVYHRLEDLHVRRMIARTLDEMAAGGMYDHLGGGFHRYSVDAAWQVPHFEKMLYDNALLATIYLQAGARLAEPRYFVTARETLDWVARDMRDPRGGFYSTQDADSEGEEGKYYVWNLTDLLTLLGSEAGEALATYYQVRLQGNWEGKSILHARPGQVVPAELEPVRARLLAERAGRVPPARDDKVVAAWNGLMLEAYATGAVVLGDERYRDIARASATFLQDELFRDGTLLRVWKNGEAAIPGFLEDYANVGVGALALYEATFEERWIRFAWTLGDRLVELFWDEAAGAFYDSGALNEELVLRPRDPYDNATPAGNSSAAVLLLGLHALTGDARHRQVAQTVLGKLAGLMARIPSGFGRLLCAADRALAETVEVAIAGDPADPRTAALVAAARGTYAPYRAIALRRPGSAPAVPLLDGRDLVDGRPAAYVCRNFACEAPVTDPAALAAALGN